ncbi:hypothetical protein [Streptomyces sp. NBC_01408]|uniref:hypothetical protein n=1 Tax=Streptomyces sp. NBC_01408 TaxID=2903855 RepID=UPI0022567D4D|nr:hypothetical protein [Streptomyces sp. NBC_01408]MCX4696372.1 hypothetical protein [Streptomyces sp. NBC_01408]
MPIPRLHEQGLRRCWRLILRTDRYKIQSNQAKKSIATVLAGIWFLTPFLGDPPEKNTANAKPQPAVTAAATPLASTSPTPTPTKSAEPQMPTVVGKPFGEAEKAVEDLIDKKLTALSAYNDVELPAAYADWVVCFQGPEGGVKLFPAYANTSVYLVAPGTACPAEKNTGLHPKPAPTPAQPRSGTRTHPPPADRPESVQRAAIQA